MQLRACGLPSCGFAEASPLDFRVCAICNAVAYCCEAHSAAHWRDHRRGCISPIAAAAGAVAGTTPTADDAGSAPSGAAGAVAGQPVPPAAPSPTSAPRPVFPSPSPEDVATLRGLTEKLAAKMVLMRFGRAAKLAVHAANLAFRMARR